jgi:hypothetical protein
MRKNGTRSLEQEISPTAYAWSLEERRTNRRRPPDEIKELEEWDAAHQFAESDASNDNLASNKRRSPQERFDNARIIEWGTMLVRGNWCREPEHDTYIPSIPIPHTADLCTH